jgi:lipoprotein-releasing system permease protein
MNHVASMIAWRYLTRSAHEGTISSMVLISFCGIFIGSFSLALIAAIMHGFDIETQRTLQGIHAQAIINARGDALNVDALSPVLEHEFSSVVAAFTPTSLAHGLLQEDTENPEPPAIILIRAIDPEREPLVSSLSSLTKPTGSMADVTQNGIIIGAKLAAERSLQLGDIVQIYHAEDSTPKRNKVTFNTHEAYIAGFLHTGIDECDSGMILCSFDFFNTLFPDVGVQEIHLRFSDAISTDTALRALKKRLSLNIYSWQELYPALVSALLLEKYVSCLVLALITLVASMNIIALIFMKITAKRTDIAILKALGLSHTSITTIFLLFGMAIALSAALCGLLGASITSWLLDHYQLITLPDVYYVTYVPSHMSWPIPVGVLLLVTMVSFCACWIPARKTRTLSVAQTLRFEE